MRNPFNFGVGTTQNGRMTAILDFRCNELHMGAGSSRQGRKQQQGNCCAWAEVCSLLSASSFAVCWLHFVCQCGVTPVQTVTT